MAVRLKKTREYKRFGFRLRLDVYMRLNEDAEKGSITVCKLLNDLLSDHYKLCVSKIETPHIDKPYRIQ
jgi:hypothetical protein